MKRNEELNKIISTFSELYWLKPVDIVWDSVNAYHIQKMINDNDTLLDLGCGDGLCSALMFGGKLPIEYDRFLNVKPTSQKIQEEQFGDIYSDPVESKYLEKEAKRKIEYALELKEHHIKVAKSLNLYDEIKQGRFENIPFQNKLVDKVFSIFAFYWGDDMDRQMHEVYNVLKDDGEFIVNLPSEHLYDMHLAKKMSDESNISNELKDFYEEMDGGRRKLTTRYSKSIPEWKEYFKKYNFEIEEVIPVVNEVMFTMQDISQRPFLPAFFKMAESEEFKPFRNIVKDYLCKNVYLEIIDNLLKYESEKHIKHGYYLVRAKKV